MKVAITDISIKERVRQDMGDLTALMSSMRRHGQLNPITITRNNELIAGHRRLLAATELGWSCIEALVVDRDSETEKLQLELEENVHRKDFSPEELLAGYRRLEKLLRPSLTRRISTFFGNLFSKLFRRKKRLKTPQEAPVQATEVPAIEDVAPEQPESKTEIGQYGV